jgi:hypothetical protein
MRSIAIKGPLFIPDKTTLVVIYFEVLNSLQRDHVVPDCMLMDIKVDQLDQVASPSLVINHTNDLLILQLRIEIGKYFP